MLTREQGERLVTLARDAIAETLGAPPVPDPQGAWLHQPAATFVTLHRHGSLHGCIGSIEPHRALLEDVKHNAVAAALHDPRATLLDLEGVGELAIEVSLLSPLERIRFTSEEDALAQIRPGVDGIVIAHGRERAIFLPQVWATLPDTPEFMRQLKRKAGLPGGFWSPDMKVHRFSLHKWGGEVAPDRREVEAGSELAVPRHRESWS
jgi:AmmeMemoRadiSam system protein A